MRGKLAPTTIDAQHKPGRRTAAILHQDAQYTPAQMENNVFGNWTREWLGGGLKI